MYSVHSLTSGSASDDDALAGLFDQYRAHYGEPIDPGRTQVWLRQQREAGRLEVLVAESDDALVGFVTWVQIPASLRLGHFWQIRDLFVHPDHRRHGVARALLEAVRSAAAAAGASRLSLQTEEDNQAALALYRSAGYLSLVAHRGLVLPLEAS